MSDALRLMQQHHNDVGFFSGKSDRADELESAIRVFWNFCTAMNRWKSTARA